MVQDGTFFFVFPFCKKKLIKNIENFRLSDGSMFRGFLEPQQLDGHEKGWCH